MKSKMNQGIVMSDITIAILILVIFVTVIAGLMFNSSISNLKAQREGMAIIYLTQHLEKIGMDDYNDVVTTISSPTKIMKADSKDAINNGFTIYQEVEEKKEEGKKGVKTVKATIQYYVGNRQYEKSLVRLKVEE